VRVRDGVHTARAGGLDVNADHRGCSSGVDERSKSSSRKTSQQCLGRGKLSRSGG